MSESQYRGPDCPPPNPHAVPADVADGDHAPEPEEHPLDAEPELPENFYHVRPGETTAHYSARLLFSRLYLLAISDFIEHRHGAYEKCNAAAGRFADMLFDTRDPDERRMNAQDTASERDTYGS